MRRRCRGSAAPRVRRSRRTPACPPTLRGCANTCGPAPSSVTYPAIGQISRVDVISRHERLTRWRRGRALPIRIEHILPGTQVGRGIAMTGEAPAHVERACLPGHRHVADRTMTLGTSDALGDVDAVVEEDVI